MVRADPALMEYLRPWKLTTLGIGLALLCYGALSTGYMDWDIPISLITGLLTYITAPWTMRVLVTRDWLMWPAALTAAWFSTDGCYAFYWSLRNPTALEMLREANLIACLPLYALVGIVWMYRGSLASLALQRR